MSTVLVCITGQLVYYIYIKVGLKNEKQMKKEIIMDFIGVASAMILIVGLMYLVMIITR